MGLFLILLRRAAAMGLCGGSNIFPDISRFSEFNSRLGILNSRFTPLRELVGKRLICLVFFAGKGGDAGKTEKIPGSTGINGNLALCWLK
jgi:hypothetical protein